MTCTVSGTPLAASQIAYLCENSKQKKKKEVEKDEKKG